MNVAIILAAGESRRMGRPKQLLPFGGATMLECVINAFDSPRIDEVLVVLGHKAGEITRKLGRNVAIGLTPSPHPSPQTTVGPASPRRGEAGGQFGSAAIGLALPIGGEADRALAQTGEGEDVGAIASFRIVRNSRYRRGMFTSVQAGLRALPPETRLVLLALCDQPRLKRATVDRLVSEFEKKRHKILVPLFNGRQGHPLLFSARYVPEILAMEETLTLKHFLANHPGDIGRLPVEDEGVLMDIDGPSDYRKAVVGRVPSRGAAVSSYSTGVPQKPPRRLKRLDSMWIGEAHPHYFLTICVEQRKQLLANDQVHARLREFLITSAQRYGWWPGRYVVMPDHLHLLVVQGEASREGTRPTTLGDWVKALKAIIGRREFRWQKDFFDHVLRSDESESEKWEYICRNPVRAGLVERVEDWPYAGEIVWESAAEAPREGTRPTEGTPCEGTRPTEETPREGMRPTT